MTSAFQALVGLSQQSLQTAKGLPAQVDIKPHWSGVGFSVLGHRFVAPMGEVTEMLEVPPYTRLPGVQSWVKGVSNVRGRLLPIIDLAAFFGGQLQTPKKIHRILILEQGDIYSGLMVDQVFGMQHFPVDTYADHCDSVPLEMDEFTGGKYHKEGLDWAVFSAQRLVADPEFINVALTGS